MSIDRHYQVFVSSTYKDLIEEQLYTSTALIASPCTASVTGEYNEMSEMTSLTGFVASFAGHIAATAARLP